MAGREHRYEIETTWTGDRGGGTHSYAGYGREHMISAVGRPPIPGSSDPQFRGDATRWNPEQLLLASLSACHQLWYLHLCATHGVVVTAYLDRAQGWMTEDADGGGQFTRVLLRPEVTVANGSDPAIAEGLHAEAHALCFIARSVSFPVEHRSQIVVAP